MTESIRRTHDKCIYIEENRYEDPKEIFKIIFARLLSSGILHENCRICDFGCAAGEFLYYLNKCYPDARYLGVDIVPELIQKAKKNVPGVSFQIGSVLDRGILEADCIDISFLIGVHSIFDEIAPCLSNLFYWTKKGGKIILFSFFNQYPVDVWVKYRWVDDADPCHREPGWNLFSKATFSKYIDEKIGPGKHKFIPFEMPFDIEQNPRDLIRTWTIKNNENRRLFTNALTLMYNMEILEITL